MNKEKIYILLESQIDETDFNNFKKTIENIRSKIPQNKKAPNQNDLSFVIEDLDQILSSKTLDRAKYYLKRTLKALTKVKTNKINDINLNRWKNYQDIITDSLWLIGKRDKTGAHNGAYWGNFVPQIPNQLIKRYTKKNDWVLDTFLGSGTTLIECKRLGRNGVGVELLSKVVKLAKENIDKENNPYEIKTEIIKGDSTSINFKEEIEKLKTKNFQLVIMHPPYWDIIKFSKNKKDLSNTKTQKEFLKNFGEIVDGVTPVLQKGRYLAVVIGDKYSNGEWIPLAFNTMQEVLNRGYKLKSTIVKNFDETKGKMKQKELWRYRALAGGFYIFKHEYIFIF
ncbi:MAG: DNA methyltransferase, partial [Ignavibacteriales bacterium CG_4_9_14_3_um_filter_30_11]